MAARIAIVTDSTADLPASLAEARQIYVVPLNILWGGESFKDGVDITPDAFYRRLSADPELPKTSQPAPADFADAFQRARAETDAEAIVALTISARLSGTFSSAEQAAKAVDFPVHVVDSQTTSFAQGMTALRLADARDAGACADEAVALARQTAASTRLFFSPNTLEYLHRGGRIGGARRLLGTALNIKPILYVTDGRIEALESVRTRRRVLSRMLDLVEEVADRSKPLHIGVVQTPPSQDGETLVEAMQARYQPASITLLQISPVLGVHVGPDAIGFALCQ